MTSAQKPGTEPDAALLAALLSAQEPEPGPLCAAPEQIFEAVRGALPTAQVRALLDHSLGCGSCAQAFRLAREIVAAAPAEALQDPAGAKVLPLRRRILWVALALPALAAAAALLVSVLPQRGEPGVRSGDAQLGSLVQGPSLPRDAFTLRWTAGPAGTHYTVTVATPALAVLHARSGLTESQLTVPAAALAPVAPGASVVWRVSALFPDGRRVESAAFVLAVR